MKYVGILEIMALIKTSLPPLDKNLLFQWAKRFSICKSNVFQKTLKHSLAPNDRPRYMIGRDTFLHFKAFAQSSSLKPLVSVLGPTFETLDLWRLILKPEANSKQRKCWRIQIRLLNRLVLANDMRLISIKIMEIKDKSRMKAKRKCTLFIRIL